MTTLRAKNIKVTFKSLAEKYGVSPTTATTILKQRDSFLNFNLKAPDEAKKKEKAVQAQYAGCRERSHGVVQRQARSR
jgi:hypothetical protein